MEPVCAYCRIRRAIVYCNTDLAMLCLQCDFTIHSADNFSLTHPRSLLCNNCVSQPAVLRCFEDDLCFCHSCVLVGNCLNLCHQFQMLSSYSGCPSMDEFTWMWTQDLDSSCSFFLDPNDEFLSSLPPNENFSSGYAKEDDGSFELVQSSSSSMPLQNLGCIPYCRDQQGPLILDMPEEVQLNFMAGDETFDYTQSYTECPQDEAITDSALIDSSIAELSSCPAETIVEASSLGNQEHKALGSSHVYANHSLLSSYVEEDNHVFSIGNSPWNASVSQASLDSETSNTVGFEFGSALAFPASDYSSTWELNLKGARNLQAREEALKRYYAKKKKRTFVNQIRYASRKARADRRKRIQGRFVKAGEAYDYDPFSTGTP